MRKHTTATTDLFEQAAGPEVFRVWLYEIEAPGGTLYYAQSRADVTYGGNTYLAAPVQHEGISENTAGKIDTLSLKVSNLNRDMSVLLELNEGLKGCRVRILQVLNLEDSSAYIEDLYWVDQVGLKGGSAKFTLSSKIDIMDATLAPRKYSRYFCSWRFMGRGCFGGFGARLKAAREAAGYSAAAFAAALGVSEASVLNWESSRTWPSSELRAGMAAALGVEEGQIFHRGYTARAGFVAGEPATCDHTPADCERHGNDAFFGGFPGVPSGKVVRA